MTTFLGMDNTEILPPFFPVFRMEDAIFGEMIKRCRQDSCFATIPWDLVHTPKEERSYPTDQLYLEDHFWPVDAVVTALQSFQYPIDQKSLTETLSSLGEHLMNFGSLPFGQYRELVGRYRQFTQAQNIKTYADLLDRYPKSPAYWVKDVKKMIELTKKTALQPLALAPGQMIETLGLEEAEKLLQKLLFRFGELVKWWPDIVKTAKDLRRKEIRLAQLLS
jgi:hypothetical protein